MDEDKRQITFEDFESQQETLMGISEAVIRIEGTQSVHTKQLESINSAINSQLGIVANNTKNMSESLRDISQTNRELISVVAGKWQVPIVVVVILFLLLGAVMLARELALNGGEAKFSHSGFEIKQGGGNN